MSTDTGRPDVVPLYPRRGNAEEARSWRSVFLWISSHPPDDWRQDPRARALMSAAEGFLGVGAANATNRRRR